MKSFKVIAAIIEKDGKIFIARRKKGSKLGSKWEFPGGKLEGGETPEECLKRELWEEFGVAIDVFDCIGEISHTYKEEDFHILLSGYFARHIAGEFIPQVHDDMRWVRADELSKYDFAHADIPFFAKIKERYA